MEKKMGIKLIKNISLLLLFLSAALFSTSFAGRLCKSEESKKVSTTEDDQEMESWGQIRNERILKVRTNDYGKYDPAPALVKPPFKLIPN